MVGVVFAIVYAGLMGVASLFSRRGMERASFRPLLGISLAVGAVIFLPLTAVTTGFADVPFRGLLYAAVGSVVGSVGGRALYFLGINYLGPGKSLSVFATSPLYAAVFAWLILEENITLLVITGTLAIVVGIAVLSRDVRSQTEREGNPLWVALYPLSGAVLAAIAIVARKLALQAGIAPVEAATVNMVVGLAVVAPIMMTRWRGRLADLDRTALWYFLVASTIMAVAFLFYFAGLQVTNASIFFPLVQTQPLFAVALSAVFLRRLEIITQWTVLGSSIIVGGAALVIIG